MRALIRLAAVLLVALTARTSAAQVVDPELFGDGKPPLYKEEDMDRRFLKTGIYRALNEEPKDVACKKVVATLLVAYADALPYLHRKDQSFFVDMPLLQTVRASITTSDFPAVDYLQAMIRRTMIDKKVPAAWIATGERLKKELQAPIATGRMDLFAERVDPIDSFSYTMDALLNRYAREVKLAPSVAVDAAEDKFRDKYMDRDVTWGGLLLYDIAKQAPPEPPKPKKGKKHKKHEEEEPPPAPVDEPTWAVVGFPVGTPQATVPGVPGSGQVPQIEIRARLKDDQKVDVTKFARGTRVLLKGHLWDIGPNMAYVEVRDAYLFPDPDWRTWPGIATPADVFNCDLAVNDLSPYGYQPRNHRTTAPDPYVHHKE